MEHSLTSEGCPGHQSNVNGSCHFQLHRVTFKLICSDDIPEIPGNDFYQYFDSEKNN